MQNIFFRRPLENDFIDAVISRGIFARTVPFSGPDLQKGRKYTINFIFRLDTPGFSDP